MDDELRELLFSTVVTLIPLLIIFSLTLLPIIIGLKKIFKSPEPKGSVRGVAKIIDIKISARRGYENASDIYGASRFDVELDGHDINHIPVVELELQSGEKVVKEATVANHAGAGEVILQIGKEVTVCYMPNRGKKLKIKILSQHYIDKKSGKLRAEYKQELADMKALRKQREAAIAEKIRNKFKKNH